MPRSAAPPQPVIRPQPPVLVAGTPFTPAELQSMAADGVLRRLVGEAYVPSGIRPGPDLRARALAALLPPRVLSRAIAGRLTAAWVFGCAAAPDAPVLLVDSSRRLARLRSSDRLLVHEVGLGPFDVTELSGLQLTTPLRTAVDIAVHCEESRALPVLRRMLAHGGLGLTLGLMARGLESLPRQPHKQHGRKVLERLGNPA